MFNEEPTMTRRFVVLMMMMMLAAFGGGECVEKPTRTPLKANEGACFQSVTVKGKDGGSLSSPNYPDPYPNNAHCQWLLTTEEPNATLLLIIESLSIEADTECKLDYLQVYLGSSSLSPSLGPFCGRIEERMLRTNVSKLLLLFHSDPTTQDRGFTLRYFAQTAQDCQDLLTSDSGTIRSPGYPANYPDGSDCWTLVRVGRGRRILITFESLDMEYGDGCAFDYVRVMDGHATNSSLLGQFCSQSDLTTLESSSNSLLVHFHSDSSVNRKGFRAKYSSVDDRSSPTGNCLWTSSESNGTVASPNYPSNYPSHSNCSLWILAPREARILVTFDALQLEMDPECAYDFLQIEEASNNGTKVLGRFCGNEGEPRNLTSTRNELHIVFQTDDFVEFSGFKLRYLFLGGEKKKKEKSPKLSFRVVPQNDTLELGSSHSMHCAASETTATVRWLKGETFLSGGNPLPGLKVLANGTLWIQSMDHSLAGIYSCIVSNTDETVTSKAYILVKDGPKDTSCAIVFRKPPADLWVSEGEFLQLECVAVGQRVRVSWEREGSPLVSGGRVTALKNGLLLVEGAERVDAGVYTCVARDLGAGCERRASALVHVSKKIDIEEVCGKSNVSEEQVPQSEHGKIIGGHDAKKGAHPWQAMLWEPSLQSFCGGSLLNERWIATAAHCFVNYRNLRWDRVVVQLGKHDTQEPGKFRTGIDDVVVHPAYDRHTFDNDLALLKLREHAPFGDGVTPVCLGRDLDLSKSGTLGTVVGWGKLKDNGPSPRFLQEIRLPVVEQEKCVASTNYTVTRNMFCAGYSQEILGDACHGDSGGPFLVRRDDRWHLLGVVSWGEGCGKRDKYGFYTRLPNYASWIRGIIKS